MTASFETVLHTLRGANLDTDVQQVLFVRFDELLASMVELGIARPADAGARFFIPS
ncbi:MAG: hypothetical protein V2I65_08800 [Paracoccaceae bacterium]|jgi:hypothetical protein|nr:hypothetical protein [Paracoccaceae bacterium]